MNNYQPTQNLLRDRVILVTGAAGGIGKAAALTFAAYGANVILLDKEEKKLESVYDQIEASDQPPATMVTMDLATTEVGLYVRLAEQIKNEFGRLDGMLHNAALLGALTPLEHYDLLQWQSVLQVNLYAPYLLTRYCLDLLRAANDASVVFTTAEVGQHGRAYWGPYAIAAAAIENMMQTWADELENTSNIRMNSIDPGSVRTDMYKQAFIEDEQHHIPKPAAIMTPYLYLMGADSRGTTGQHILAQQ